MEKIKKIFTGILLLIIVATNNGTLLFDQPVTHNIKVYAAAELKYSITVSKDLINILFIFNNKFRKS